MWSPFNYFLPLAAGFVGDFQQTLNTSRGEMTLLTSNQFAEFIPYAEFARAAYCVPNKIAEWQCGGKFSPYPTILSALTGLLIRPKALAAPSKASYQR
jgi:hypothetical protein